MEGINREIVEKKVYEEGKKEYASKGVGNAGLALGIVGTALGAGLLTAFWLVSWLFLILCVWKVPL